LLGLIQNLHWVQELVLTHLQQQQHLPPLLWVGGAAGWAIYIKTYLKAKEGLWKLKYFTMQKYNLQEIL
jgi:hypothetical protein